jgi:hypothetical protein
VAAIDGFRRGLWSAQRALRALGERRGGTRALPFVAMARVLGVLGGGLAAGQAPAAELPGDRADLMYHLYDGGGVRAHGPAVLVRKSLLNKVSLSGLYYADIVSNASIDVVTTASPYRETRNEFGVVADYAVRDALITLSAARSTEPDYVADTYNLDVTQEVFAAMTSVSLGFTYGSDDVGRKDVGFFDSAKHWRYRLGVTQILSPRWLASANFEVVSDDGYLGNPYRVALVFGAAVPERVPSTRSSRALRVRVIGEVAPGWSVGGAYRYFWDNWDITAHTFDLGVSRRFGEAWLVDAYVRAYRQADSALFYSDNATTETLYVSRNRQLSEFDSTAIGTKATWTWLRVPGRYEVRLSGALEYGRTNFSNFTDLRTGSPYSFNATVAQVFVSADF